MVLPMPGQQGPPPTPPREIPFLRLPEEFSQDPGFQPVEEELPKKPKRRKPSVDEIRKKADRVVDFWRERDQRMDEDETYYLLTYGDDARQLDERVIVRNTPRVVIDKGATMLGSQLPRHELRSPHESLKEIAQRVENLLRQTYEQAVDDWEGRINPPFYYSVSHYTLLRGWITIRVRYQPESADDLGWVPVEYRPFDPRCVYPDPNKRFVVHRYQAIVSDILSEWEEEAEKAGLDEREFDDTLEVTEYYDDWWHCVTADNITLKSVTAHEYGFVPWSIAVMGGSPMRGSDLYVSTPDWTRGFGPSFIEAMKDPLKAQNRLLSQIAEQNRKATDPPTIVYYDPELGQPAKLVLDAGVANYLVQGKENVQPLSMGAAPADVAAILQSTSQDIQRSSLPDILFGTGADGASGFQASLMSAAAKDATYRPIMALRSAWKQLNTMTLTILRDIHKEPIGVMAYDSGGSPIGLEVVHPHEIAQVGIRTEVKYPDLAPRDMFQMVQMGLAVMKEKGISMHTFRGDYLGIDNPKREEDKVLQELAFSDPEIMKEYALPMALKKYNPEMYNIWLVKEMAKQQQAFQAARMPPPGQPPASGPPPGPPPGMPGGPGLVPAPGQPPTAVPAPMSPRPFNALQQSAASAAGGSGVLRLPGISGLGGQLPRIG